MSRVDGYLSVALVRSSVVRNTRNVIRTDVLPVAPPRDTQIYVTVYLFVQLIGVFHPPYFANREIK